MNINWFPGHMKKTRDLLKENLKLVDIVFELLDSRIPFSSKNPEIDKIILNKPRIIILNKSDLSDQYVNKLWINYFEKENTKAILMNSKNPNDTKKLLRLSNELLEEKLNRLKQRGIRGKTIRAMIAGIPNVGKSTLINALAGRKSAKTGNKPGVTTGKQWIKLRGNIELLDTPGILWPKFEDETVALNLAFTGAIKDTILDIETLSIKLIERLLDIDKTLIENRYNINTSEKTPLQLLEEIAFKRGCIVKSNDIDYSRVANILLDEFRNGTIGKISLEKPQ